MAVVSPLSSRLTVAALLTLTVVTGLVDAVSYLGLGRVFVANMTGNVVFLGFSVDPHAGLSAPASLTAIGGFLVGALVGGRAAHMFAAAHPARWLATAFGVEAVILGLVAVLAVTRLLPFAGAGSLVAIAVLAAALGVQNSTVRHLGAADLTTTVLTLTLTGLAADSALAGGTGASAGIDRRHACRCGRWCRHPAVVADRGHRDRRRAGRPRLRRFPDETVLRRRVERRARDGRATPAGCSAGWPGRGSGGPATRAPARPGGLR